MPSLQIEQVEYKTARLIERRLKTLGISKPTAVANELAKDLLLEAWPVTGLEPIEAWRQGILFYHGDVDEKDISDMQIDLIETHQNIALDKAITLNLSSFGGLCYPGLALTGTIQSLRREKRIVNCHIQGYAMSMGSIIAQACDQRIMDADATMMLHKSAFGLADGTRFDDCVDELAALKRLQDILFGMYGRRTGMPVEYYDRKLFKTEWYMTAEEALEERLIDTIAPAPPFKTFRRRTTGSV